MPRSKYCKPNLPKSINWAFTEDYPPTKAPNGKWPRKLGLLHNGKNGEVSAGDGIMLNERYLDFMCSYPAFIASQSGVIYGKAGQQQRSQDESQLMKDIAIYLNRENLLNSV